MNAGDKHALIICLRGIEAGYRNFPKATQIRIERWVDKLALGYPWKKDQLLYARLLCLMVKERKIEPPFTELPDENHLKPFPLELKSRISNYLEEGSFWKDLYLRMDANKTLGSSSSSDVVVKPMLAITSSSVQSERDHSMTLLIREQTARIQLLETLLYEERIKHEIQLKDLISKQGDEFQVTSDSKREQSTSHDSPSRIAWSKFYPVNERTDRVSRSLDSATEKRSNEGDNNQRLPFSASFSAQYGPSGRSPSSASVGTFVQSSTRNMPFSRSPVRSVKLQRYAGEGSRMEFNENSRLWSSSEGESGRENIYGPKKASDSVGMSGSISSTRHTMHGSLSRSIDSDVGFGANERSLSERDRGALWLEDSIDAREEKQYLQYLESFKLELNRDLAMKDTA